MLAMRSINKRKPLFELPITRGGTGRIILCNACRQSGQCVRLHEHHPQPFGVIRSGTNVQLSPMKRIHPLRYAASVNRTTSNLLQNVCRRSSGGGCHGDGGRAAERIALRELFQSETEKRKMSFEIYVHVSFRILIFAFSLRLSVIVNNGDEQQSVDTREKAFMHAVSAAGVAYSITKACRDGKFSSCSCDTNVHKRKMRANEKMNSQWEWGGCSDDVAYGQQLSKDFVDANDLAKLQGDPAPTLMSLHNNEAGRQALRQNTKLSCKCHGVSGSCTTRICWRQLTEFPEIGRTLYRRFDSAILVEFNMRKHKLKSVTANKRPRKRDLVYLQESPDYCESNERFGIVGTSGRECKLNSYEGDNCEVLCCGRGYETTITETKQECNCAFVWCCQVQCKICVKKTKRYFCR